MVSELPIEERERILSSSIRRSDRQARRRADPIEGRATILWRGEGPDDLPRRGRDNGPVRPYTP
jgi:hypothetical protein